MVSLVWIVTIDFLLLNCCALQTSCRCRRVVAANGYTLGKKKHLHDGDEEIPGAWEIQWNDTSMARGPMEGLEETKICWGMRIPICLFCVLGEESKHKIPISWKS